MSGKKREVHFPKQRYSPQWGNLVGDVELDDTDGKATDYLETLKKQDGNAWIDGHKKKPAEKTAAKK